MLKRTPLLALLMLSPTLAHAQLADLSVELTHEVIANSSAVVFTVTVTNVSNDTAFSPGPGVLVDLMLFPNQPQMPSLVDGDGYPELQVPLPSFIAPGGQWTHQYNWDFEVPGNYSAWAMVDTLAFDPQTEMYSYPETTKDNNLAGPVAVVIEEKVGGKFPDLIIASFTASVSGFSVSYEIKVQNLGNAPSPDGAFVDVLFNSEQCPPEVWTMMPVMVYGDVSAKIPAGGLAAGQTQTVIIANASPPAGTVKSCAAVDIDGLVEEKSEANNFFGPVIYEVDAPPDDPQPDLDITVFQVQSFGDQIKYTVHIKNKGTAPTAAFTVDLWRDSLTQPIEAQLADHFWTIPGLAAGQTWEGTHVQESVSNGEKNAWVWAAPPWTNAVTTDSNPDNNKDGPFKVLVNVPQDKPDLVVKSFEWEQTLGEVLYYVTVKNQGSQPATNASVDLIFDFEVLPDCLKDDFTGVPADTQIIESLPPDAQVTLEFVWTPAAAGEYRSWVKLDCFNEIDESDDTNNDDGPLDVAFQPILAQALDLRMVDFKVGTSCTTVNYTMTVRNDGQPDSAPFESCVFFDAETNPGYGQTGDRCLIMPEGLGGGESQQITFKIDSLPSGSYQSWAITDNKNEVSEELVDEGQNIGEGNNIAFVNFSIDEEGCRCAQNEEITEPCACGSETFFEGYCCYGQWGFEAFEECIDGNMGGDMATTGDVGMTGGDDDLGGATGGNNPDASTGGPGATFTSLGERQTDVIDSGCTAGPGSGRHGGLIPLAAMLVALALFRVRRPRQPAPHRAR